MFKYEKLHEFCYCCEKLNHHEGDCPLAIQIRKESRTVKREYGAWLKANLGRGVTVSRSSFDSQHREGSVNDLGDNEGHH
ncbi:hypothetical protein REPUB_Repub02eG0106000 [Reevesia pubescens]